MSDLMVMKFGGTSLGTPARIRNAARRVRAHIRAGQRAVVVVSAVGHTTDRMLAWVDGVAPRAGSRSSREIDRVLAAGEEMAAGLVASALDAFGVPATSLRGGEAGIEADGPFGGGAISGFRGDRLQRLLEAGITPVVAGFQAVRADGETVTLGRGGSDLTAVFLAGAMGAESCHIVTDVDGVYDSDPRVNPSALRLAELSHHALVELVEGGAQVVQPAAAWEAHRSGIPLYVYSFRARPGGDCGTSVRVALAESHSYPYPEPPADAGGPIALAVAFEGAAR